MPVGEIAGGLFRLLGQFFVEIVGEFLVRGVGYGICRRISPAVSPDGWPVAVVGLLFWVAVFSIGYVAYIHAAEWLTVDSCLDSGGSYNYQSEICVHG